MPIARKRTPVLTDRLIPAHHRAMPQAKANGIEIEYDTFGDSSADPMLLIMGLGSQMVLWHEDFCEELASHGHWVIRFDNRDVGKSTHLSQHGAVDIPTILAAVMQGTTVDAPYGMTDMADDAIGLLTALGIPRAHVVGVSMGGMIAQTAALRHRDRVKSLTSIMSTPGDPDMPPPQPHALLALAQPMEPTVEGAIQRGLEVFRAIGSPGFETDEEFIRERATLQFDRGFDPDGVTRQMAAILGQEGRRAALATLDVPTMVIHGTDDPLVPVECGKATAEAVPGAELLLIEGMGHDQPRAVWPRLIDAITGVAKRASV